METMFLFVCSALQTKDMWLCSARHKQNVAVASVPAQPVIIQEPAVPAAAALSTAFPVKKDPFIQCVFDILRDTLLRHQCDTPWIIFDLDSSLLVMAPPHRTITRPLSLLPVLLFHEHKRPIPFSTPINITNVISSLKLMGIMVQPLHAFHIPGEVARCLASEAAAVENYKKPFGWTNNLGATTNRDFLCSTAALLLAYLKAALPVFLIDIVWDYLPLKEDSLS